MAGEAIKIILKKAASICFETASQNFMQNKHKSQLHEYHTKKFIYPKNLLILLLPAYIYCIRGICVSFYVLCYSTSKLNSPYQTRRNCTNIGNHNNI